MHRWVRLPISFLLLTPVSSHSFGSGDAPAPVRCAKVVARTAALGKAFIGSVQPARRSVVGTAVAGRVETVLVEPGDFTDNAGKLVELRLTAIRIRLASARADLEVAQQQLAELEAGPRIEDIHRLEARVKAATAVQNYASKKFERLAALSQRGASARDDLEEALSAKVAAEQNLVAATAEYDAAVTGTRKEQLAQWRAKLTKAQEELNRIQDELNEHVITAPFQGFVVSRHVERGQWVQLGDPIAEIVELNPAEIRVSIPEQYVSLVRQGNEVRIDVAAIRSAGRTDVLLGNVFRIIPDADPRSRSFPVVIRIDNPSVDGSPLLKPGMLAKVFLPVGQTKKDVLSVPKDALVLDRDRTYVVVADHQGGNTRRGQTTVRRIKVEVGAIHDRMVHIKPIDGTTISIGDEVVIEGNERLESGQRVVVLGD